MLRDEPSGASDAIAGRGIRGRSAACRMHRQPAFELFHRGGVQRGVDAEVVVQIAEDASP